MGNFPGGIFLLDGGNLTRSSFDYSNLFQSCKQHSVNIERWLKSKLAWPVCTKEYGGKIKMAQQWLQLKMKILLGCDMKIVLVRGEWTFCESNLLGRTFPGGGGMGEFLASVGGTPPIPPVEKTLLLSTPPKKKCEKF